MPDDNWDRIQEIFLEAADLRAPERAAFLERACNGDEFLRSEVEALLRSDSRGPSALDATVEIEAAALLERPLRSGTRLGPYRLLEEIGRGGMGSVYLAERDDDQFRKQVAIKVVRRGMDTDEVLNRFRHERQILASLEHPYIARLIDGGTTDDGRPFFVMEKVDGEPIDAYCSRHKLDLKSRLRLFLKVCEAVSHAHRSLVVHRDLKPGNILVAAEGVPKLLDFGVAKLLDPVADPGLTATHYGARPGTPEYASPEQVRGLAVTTTTDVYALGSILFELLTGTRAQKIDRITPAEIERVVCETQPPRPSLVAKGLNRDLDNIVLMAMHKDPSRRYGSVAEFAEDLQRYLDGLPVKAREDTVTYRAQKFVRRHRTSVAAGVLLSATLVTGVAVSTLEARRAQRRFEEVRRIAHAVLYDLHDAIRDLPGSLKAREIVVKTALQYLDGLAGEAAGDADLQAELAEAYERVGDVQGSASPNQSGLGQMAQATVSYGKARKIADELAERHPESIRANLVRMASRESLGDIAALYGDIEASLKWYRDGEEIGEAMAQRNPHDLQSLRSLAELYDASSREDQDNARATASAKKSLALFERLTAARPASEEAQSDLADAHSELSSILESGNHFEEAIEEARKGVRIDESLVAAHPLSVRFRYNLMDIYEKLGDAASGATSAANQRPRDTPEALDSYHKAAEMADALVAADPADRRALEERGMALLKLGMTISPEKDLNGAVTTLRRAQTDFRMLAEAHPGEARVLRRLAATHLYIGRRLASRGHTTEAAPSLREAIRITDTVLGKNPKDLVALNYSWRASQELAKILASGLQRSEAVQFSAKAIAAAQTARSADGANPVTQSFLPQAYANAGDVYAALAAAPEGFSEHRREDWNRACDSYRKSVEAWEPIQRQGAGTNDWAAQLAHARGEAKRCTTAAAAFR
jgi:hypothetical protein